MKHLQLFENFKDIDAICKKYGITNYTINPDGTVDVDDLVDLFSRGLTKLPLKFGRVTGNFNCNHNQLTTLEGCPKEVGGNFNCNHNQLTTLEGCPKEVGDSFYCNDNLLTTLEGSPKKVGEYFICNKNKLTTLKGCPEEVGGGFSCLLNELISLEGGPKKVGSFFDCSSNKLTSLEGYPKELDGYFECWRNPIENIYNLFGSLKEFQDSMDYGYLRGTDIIKLRFKEALEEIGVKLPKEIKGYNYI